MLFNWIDSGCPLRSTVLPEGTFAGYDFLEKDAANASSLLAPVAQSLLRRQMAIIAGGEQRSAPPEAAKGASTPK